MLVLSRRVGERIAIGADIEIEILQIRGHQVRVGVCAPATRKICRMDARDSARDELRRSLEDNIVFGSNHSNAGDRE